MPARLFAALGDPTRLGLIARLSAGEMRSIAALREGSPLTRQGLTRHLDVLEEAGLVRSRKEGRETLYALELAPFRTMGDYLAAVSAHWDDALLRLKLFAEKD